MRLMELNWWHNSLPLLPLVLSWQLLWLQQPKFVMILQSSYFHGSLVVNSGLIEHFLSVASKLLPYSLLVVDSFSTPSNHYKITDFLVIHFFKGTHKFWWCTNKIFSIVRPDHPYYSSSTTELSETQDERICA